MKVVLLVILSVLLLGCQPPMTPAERDATEVKDLSTSTGGYDLRRVIDKEAGVVCYVHVKGSVFCLPITSTKLDEGR